MAHTTAILLLVCLASGLQACELASSPLYIVPIVVLSCMLAGPLNLTVSVLSPTSVNISWYLNVTGRNYVCSVRAKSGSLELAPINNTCDTVSTDPAENSSLGFSQTVGNLCPRTNYTYSVKVNDTECSPLQTEPFSINASKCITVACTYASHTAKAVWG